MWAGCRESAEAGKRENADEGGHGVDWVGLGWRGVFSGGRGEFR